MSIRQAYSRLGDVADAVKYKVLTTVLCQTFMLICWGGFVRHEYSKFSHICVSVSALTTLCTNQFGSR